MFIENKTPYIGKLKLKFEKYPHYTGSSKLNKIHLNLGFTKLVSRIVPISILNGWMVDPKKVELIEKHTNGIIGEHWIDNREPKTEFTLPNSFLTKDGTYIGDVETGWWYYKNGFKVCEDYPHGVAEYWEGIWLEGYYGYTHRGGQLFKIGDKLFDENWIPSPLEIKESWVDNYEQSTGKTFRSNDEYESLTPYIPFKERGSITIKTLDQCKEAAINMSKYLS